MNDDVLLDTHTLFWLVGSDRRLGRRARERAKDAVDKHSLLVSAMSFWEIAMLVRRRRLDLYQPVLHWREPVLQLGIEEIAVSGDTASAVLRDATLVTADESILAWNGNLHRHDARV